MSAITNHIIKQIKSLLNDCVIYIESEDNRVVTDYLKTNLKDIQALFESKYKTFIIATNNDLDTNLKDVVSYFYPRINLDTFNFHVDNYGSYILELLGFKVTNKCGLLLIDEKSVFTDLSNFEVKNLKSYLTQYVNNIYVDEFDDLPFSSDSNFDSKIALDDETQELVYAVIDKFNMLKENGSLLSVLPIIEQYIKENGHSNIDDLSSLVVDDDYNIILSDYNNLEIKLSHLTKSVYLLFLNHPEGIRLKELSHYKDELLGYYKLISNRLDYDKMLESINDIINTETNAIYVHISRIKSVFTKSLHPKIAQNYYIQGGKDKIKKIELDIDLIQYKNSLN